MITIEASPQHVLAMRLAGTVEQNDIKVLAGAFEQKVLDNDRVNLVVDMSSWADITGPAMIEDAKFELAQLRRLSQVSRVAFISEKQFMLAIATMVRTAMPMIEIKAFAPENYDQALAFASELPAPKPAPQPSLKFIDTGCPTLIAYEIDGTLMERDVEAVVPLLEAAFERNETIDLFARIKNFAGFDPVILTDSSLLSVKLSAITHVRRYAVVGAPAWMKQMFGVVGSLLPIAIRFYDEEAEGEAWAWLKS